MIQRVKTARAAATHTLNRLREQGYTAYLAGGCVRDALLGQTPKDYDIATDATPQDIQRLFPRCSPVGAAFGVVLVYTPATGGRPRWHTEVATFRAEGAYSDGRRPDAVRFTTAEEDAQRRDFTINGLFAEPVGDGADPSADRIIDYVGGRADLEAGIVRAIGDPGERFGEDYLRMLRAVRFAARLGFAIDPTTSAALRAHARYLGQISRERIGQELLAMLNGPRPALALHLLHEHKLDGPTLNEDPADTALNTTDALDPAAQAPTRLAAWLIDRHGTTDHHRSIVARWRRALSLSNDHRDAINRLLDLMGTLTGWADLGTAARKRLIVRPGWEQGLMLWHAIGQDADTLRQDAARLTCDGIGLAPAPLLTGEDLIDRGLEPGPDFKTLLDRAYDRQLAGELTDREQALHWLGQAVGRP